MIAEDKLENLKENVCSYEGCLYTSFNKSNLKYHLSKYHNRKRLKFCFFCGFTSSREEQIEFHECDFEDEKDKESTRVNDLLIEERSQLDADDESEDDDKLMKCFNRNIGDKNSVAMKRRKRTIDHDSSFTLETDDENTESDCYEYSRHDTSDEEFLLSPIKKKKVASNKRNKLFKLKDDTIKPKRKRGRPSKSEIASRTKSNKNESKPSKSVKVYKSESTLNDDKTELDESCIGERVELKQNEDINNNQIENDALTESEKINEFRLSILNKLEKAHNNCIDDGDGDQTSIEMSFNENPKEKESNQIDDTNPTTTDDDSKLRKDSESMTVDTSPGDDLNKKEESNQITVDTDPATIDDHTKKEELNQIPVGTSLNQDLKNQEKPNEVLVCASSSDDLKIEEEMDQITVDIDPATINVQMKIEESLVDKSVSDDHMEEELNQITVGTSLNQDLKNQEKPNEILVCASSNDDLKIEEEMDQITVDTDPATIDEHLKIEESNQIPIDKSASDDHTKEEELNQITVGSSLTTNDANGQKEMNQIKIEIGSGNLGERKEPIAMQINTDVNVITGVVNNDGSITFCLSPDKLSALSGSVLNVVFKDQ